MDDDRGSTGPDGDVGADLGARDRTPLPLDFILGFGVGDPITSLTDLTGTPAVELVRIRYASALRVRSFKFHQNGAARASTVMRRVADKQKKDVRVCLGHGSDQRPRFATSA